MKHPHKVAAKLAKLLTPETDRQPRIDGQGWFIYWRPHRARGERLCVGVAFTAYGEVYRQLIDDDQAAAVGQLYGHAALVNLSTMLDAAASRLEHGDTTPPPNLDYDPISPVRGDTPAEILAMLWANGPALLVGKKKDAAAAPVITRQNEESPAPSRTHAEQDEHGGG
ncbi:hypothetical protein NH8B_1952 [Pseudogulbenkiania sp. NH8B]|uniref:hypothetical protein n=1 Tax=Pseudogulbenkiania sp. (strain NH8B) TaxID=748280 RepID=UPI0002279FED|nr:hypothetical protein [Pseudogulbenkiania sp. NH8B]BAK76767.1 hypothetical protein NH8B_1952 [Pseudogulbenkiania sp. NH8B]